MIEQAFDTTIDESPERAAYREFLQEGGYVFVVFTPDDRWIGVLRLNFHWTFHVGRIGDMWGHDRRFCYQTFDGALDAINEWACREFEGEPIGWHKDPYTGRVRVKGDPKRQYKDGEYRPDLEREGRWRSIVILTGAGISAESGISTFRDADGLWDNHAIEDVCTSAALMRNPVRVHDFYDARRAQMPLVEPNAAHAAIARLHADWHGKVTVVTQNIDNLHERAGSTNVIHMHGELCSALCTACMTQHPWPGDLPAGSECPTCSQPTLRPNIVMFGEMPYRQDEIDEAIENCDVFIAIGTSGVVYPAAALSSQAKRAGATTIEVNLHPTGGRQFSTVYEGLATVEVNRLVDDLIALRV